MRVLQAGMAGGTRAGRKRRKHVLRVSRFALRYIDTHEELATRYSRTILQQIMQQVMVLQTWSCLQQIHTAVGLLVVPCA